MKRRPAGVETAVSPNPARVVVIGGSLAGLFAAAAAADGSRRVTVIERDVLPQGPQPRPGVPQSQQPHIFLYRGLLALEQLLPGLRDDLLGGGAVPFDTGDLPWLGESGWLPLGRRTFEVLSATRPLFEQVVRRRVVALSGVEIRDSQRVSAIGPRGHEWVLSLADGDEVAADLVVDASGRGSRLPVWLAAADVAAAPRSEVDAHVGYATRMYAADPAVLPCPGVVVLATTRTLAGGLALRVEEGRMLVGAVGFGAQRPPRDPAGFEGFLRTLRDPVLSELVARAEPLGDVAVHRQTGNRRYLYETVRGWPDGVLAVGDALCSFDPVYGQGITVAACEALLLRRALADGVSAGYARRLLRAFASVVALPWAIAAGEDLRMPTSSGRQSPAQAVFGRWARELGRLAVHGDPLAADALSRVYHLMGSPALLLQPALFASAARARLIGYGPPAPRPAVLAGLVGT